MDLQSEHERWLTEEHVKAPVVVMNYPKEIKAFYMRMNDDGKTVAAMDVLAPGIGEIIGGSQREERLRRARRAPGEMDLDPKAYWWYRDLRRYGTVPHAGFGLGFERTIIYATGMANIRDVIPFPRTPGHAAFLTGVDFGVGRSASMAPDSAEPAHETLRKVCVSRWRDGGLVGRVPRRMRKQSSWTRDHGTNLADPAVRTSRRSSRVAPALLPSA